MCFLSHSTCYYCFCCIRYTETFAIASSVILKFHCNAKYLIGNKEIGKGSNARRRMKQSLCGFSLNDIIFSIWKAVNNNLYFEACLVHSSDFICRARTLTTYTLFTTNRYKEVCDQCALPGGDAESFTDGSWFESKGNTGPEDFDLGFRALIA